MNGNQPLQFITPKSRSDENFDNLYCAHVALANTTSSFQRSFYTNYEEYITMKTSSNINSYYRGFFRRNVHRSKVQNLVLSLLPSNLTPRKSIPYRTPCTIRFSLPFSHPPVIVIGSPVRETCRMHATATRNEGARSMTAWRMQQS